MDYGRRCNAGSETKYFISHSTAGSINITMFVSVPLALKSYGEYAMDPDDTRTQSGLHFKGKPRTKDPDVLSK